MVLEKTNAIADWRAHIGPTDAHKAKVTHPDRYVVPTGKVKVPAGRYVVPTGKDNVIVSTR
ncbi:probable nucleoside diphosphate kinase 5 isoform X1, partial [Tanacetum coccineum]